MPKVLFYAAVAVAVFLPSAAAQPTMVDVDGRTLIQWPANDTAKRYKPWVAGDNGGTLLVQNMYLHDVTNQKAIFASATSSIGTYRQMTFQNLEISNVFRDAAGQAAGLHMDFLYIEGAARGAPWTTNVLVENVYMHDPDGTDPNASAQPLWLVADNGSFGTVTVRNLNAVNAATFNKIYAKYAGDSISSLIIDNCPNQKFTLGGGGTIGQVTVTNSPGITVNNLINANIFFDSISVPEPSVLGLTLVAGAGFLRRSRRKC